MADSRAAPYRAILFDAGNTLLFLDYARLAEAVGEALALPLSAAALAAAAEDRNIIPAMLDCARAYCTLYEIRHVLEETYGSYREPVFF